MSKIYKDGAELSRDLNQKIATASKEQLYVLTNEFMKDSDDLIPRQEGNMRLKQTMDSQPDEGIIKISSPQAKRLYYGLESWNWTTSGTGPMWWHKNKKNRNKKYLQMMKSNIFKGLRRD